MAVNFSCFPFLIFEIIENLKTNIPKATVPIGEAKGITLSNYRGAEKIIKRGSKEGDLVLDVFAGSGTSLVCAKKLKRNYLGYEINPEYVEIINKRLNE